MHALGDGVTSGVPGSPADPHQRVAHVAALRQDLLRKLPGTVVEEPPAHIRIALQVVTNLSKIVLSHPLGTEPQRAFMYKPREQSEFVHDCTNSRI